MQKWVQVFMPNFICHYLNIVRETMKRYVPNGFNFCGQSIPLIVGVGGGLMGR